MYHTGNPELRLALNEDLVIGKENAGQGMGVVLDDCNFHERVRNIQTDIIVGCTLILDRQTDR